MKKWLALFIAVFLLSFTPFPAEAAETVTIQNVKAKDIYNKILTGGIKDGLIVRNSSDVSLVFEYNKPRPLSFDLNWGTNAKILYYWNIVQVENDALVSFEIHIVQNPGSGREQVHVASFENINARGYFPAYKDDLLYFAHYTKEVVRSIKHYYNGGYFYGLSLAKQKKKDYVAIEAVTENSPAAIAGVLPGDMIIKVNGLAVKKMSYYEVDDAFTVGDDGASISFVVRRGDKEIPFTLTKQFYPPQQQK